VGANPVDRAKRGNKWHVAAEGSGGSGGSGMVLSLLLGPANRPDQELFEAVLDDIPPVCPRRVGGAGGPTNAMLTRATTTATAAAT
jgi:hypothetical protein